MMKHAPKLSDTCITGRVIGSGLGSMGANRGDFRPKSGDPAFRTPAVLPPPDSHDQAGVQALVVQALVVRSYQANPKA